jgi:enoyl-CoA hydratase/carnithine racemase
MTTGRRYGGPEALTAGLVDSAVSAAEVLTEAIELVRHLAGKDAETLVAIKATMYATGSRPSPCRAAVSRSCTRTRTRALPECARH